MKDLNISVGVSDFTEIRKNGYYYIDKSEFVERLPELSLFFKAFSLLNSEMICIFPYFCPCEIIVREIREISFSHCLPLYQEVWRSSALPFL